MAIFPILVDLSKKKCVIIGGGSVATRKIGVLMKFNANIIVISPQIKDEIKIISKEKKICVIRKKYSKQDIDNAFLVIAATSDKDVNMRIAEDAKNSNILVNNVDDCETSTFIFPSVITRGDITIAISTSGIYPLLTKKIKKKIEDIIPEYYERLLNVLREYRRKALTQITNKERRQKFLDVILEDELIQDIKNYDTKVSKIYKQFCR